MKVHLYTIKPNIIQTPDIILVFAGHYSPFM